MNILINSLKNFVDPRATEAKTEDDNFEEDAKDRVFAKYFSH
jgi:hypothetical protein